jgi:hypothetical protein
MVRKLIYLICLVMVMSLAANVQAVIIHQYTFNDGTANDSVGTANGTLLGGGSIAGGQVTLDGASYVDLGGPAIAINTLTDGFTLELWSTNLFDQGYTMTAAFGDTQEWWGKKYVAISTNRGDQVTRAMITDGSDNPGYTTESGINQPELYDGLQHQYVLSVGQNTAMGTSSLLIGYYIDGEFMGMMNMRDRQISSLGITQAFLGKGTYPGDALWMGDINEFTMYSTALSGADIAASYAAGPVAIPEPATMVLMGLGALSLIRRRKA